MEDCDGYSKIARECFCSKGELHFDFLPDDEMRSIENVSSTPHIAMNMFEWAERLSATETAALNSVYEEIDAQKKKRRRVHKTRWDYRSSAWVQYLNVEEDDPLFDDESRRAKVFKERFRVPWTLFYRFLLPWTCEHFPLKADALGRKGIPVEFKVLSVLRVLGRALHFDDVAEFTDSGFRGEALRIFFHEWTRLFALTFYSEWIKPPDNEEWLKKAMNLYMLAGVPGAISSLDGVHIRWDRCGYSSLQRHKGKEGHATLGFQVAVLHNTWICSCTRAFSGATNDKTITRYDEFVQQMQRGDLYGSVPFTLYTKDGTPVVHKGLYMLCDNGYHKWRVLQNPSKVSVDDDDLAWSEMVESLRKDVEATFGRLKSRFRILKYGLRLHQAEACQNVMLVCCILHNMILMHTGLDHWDDEDGLAGDAAAEDEDILRRIFSRDDYTATDSQLRRNVELRALMPQAAATMFSMFGDEDEETLPTEYVTLRRALIDHMAFVRSKGLVVWPQRARAES
jgi:hypothetical protein